jgi:hypothetical protein
MSARILIVLDDPDILIGLTQTVYVRPRVSSALLSTSMRAGECFVPFSPGPRIV